MQCSKIALVLILLFLIAVPLSAQEKTLIMTEELCKSKDCIELLQAYLKKQPIENKQINFTKGLYVFQKPIYLNISNVTLEGEQGVEIQFAAPLNGGILTPQNDNLPIRNISIRNISASFASKVSTDRNGHGILLANCDSCKLVHIKFENASGHGIYLNNSTNCTISNIEVNNNAKYGLVIKGENISIKNVRANKNGFFDKKKDILFSNIDIFDGSKNIMVQNIETSNGARDGLAIGTNPGKGELGPSNIIVQNVNSSNNGDHGFEIYCGNNVTGQDITVFNNSRNGIALYDDEDGCYSTNIIMSKITSYSNKFYGIHIQGSTNVKISEILNLYDNKLNDIQIINGIYPKNRVRFVIVGDKQYNSLEQRATNFHWDGKP